MLLRLKGIVDNYKKFKSSWNTMHQTWVGFLYNPSSNQSTCLNRVCETWKESVGKKIYKKELSNLLPN